jgi:hypothetical protein
MFAKSFWVATLERAVKTFAQAVAAMLMAGGFGLIDAPWLDALSAGGMAAVLSVLTSVGSATWGPNKGTPSLSAPDCPRPHADPAPSAGAATPA